MRKRMEKYVLRTPLAPFRTSERLHTLAKFLCRSKSVHGKLFAFSINEENSAFRMHSVTKEEMVDLGFAFSTRRFDTKDVCAVLVGYPDYVCVLGYDTKELFINEKLPGIRMKKDALPRLEVGGQITQWDVLRFRLQVMTEVMLLRKDCIASRQYLSDSLCKEDSQKKAPKKKKKKKKSDSEEDKEAEKYEKGEAEEGEAEAEEEEAEAEEVEKAESEEEKAKGAEAESYEAEEAEVEEDVESKVENVHVDRVTSVAGADEEEERVALASCYVKEFVEKFSVFKGAEVTPEDVISAFPDVGECPPLSLQKAFSVIGLRMKGCETKATERERIFANCTCQLLFYMRNDLKNSAHFKSLVSNDGSVLLSEIASFRRLVKLSETMDPLFTTREACKMLKLEVREGRVDVLPFLTM